MPPTAIHAHTPSVLVVGSTGALGSEIVSGLRARSYQVRALVRPESDPGRVGVLERAGAVRQLGDLKDRSSIAAACQGMTRIVSTATALLSRVQGDSLEGVDLRGQLDLIEAAEHAGVEHFVFVSFPPIPLDFEFQRAKRAVEERLKQSAMSYTIVHAASFCEVWLSPVLGFDPLKGYARIPGDGKQPSNWISIGDVARCSVDAVAGGPFSRKTLPLGGPDALSYLDILELFAAKGVAGVRTEHVPEAELERELQAAKDPRQEAFAALMLATARGQRVSTDAADFASGTFTTMSDYVTRTVSSARAN